MFTSCYLCFVVQRVLQPKSSNNENANDGAARLCVEYSGKQLKEGQDEIKSDNGNSCNEAARLCVEQGGKQPKEDDGLGSDDSKSDRFVCGFNYMPFCFLCISLLIGMR